VVTKSGSNSLRGTVFELHRDDALDARPYAFTPAQAAAPMAPFKWDQYGYTAGGPAWKNHLFFMSNFEGYKDRKQFQTPYTVPTAAMRSGNFAELLANLGGINAQTGERTGVIVDPTQCTFVGTTRTCAPFAGNIIPANRLNRVSKQLLEFYPEPNSGAAGLSNNNYLSFQNRVINKTQYTQRMDFVQSSASSWMGRYSYGKEDELTPALMLNGTKLNTSVHQVAVGNTRTLSSTVVNEFRFGYNDFFNTFGRELAFERDVVKELNIPGLTLNPPEAWGMPAIGITGFSGFGDSTERPYTNRNKAFEFSDNVTWIRGRHSFKVGGTIRYDMFNEVGNQFARGNFQFQNIATGYASPTSCLVTRSRTNQRWRSRDEVPRAEPGVLLRRHVEDPLEHDVRSRPALRIHAAVARQERHVDERVDPLPRHDAERAESRVPSDAGAHRLGRCLRGHRAPFRPEHSGGSRRPPWRPARVRRQEELRAADRLGLEPEREVVVPRRHGHLLYAGHRQPAVRYGAEPVGTPS
jgi:hypothetical protein